MKGFEGRFRVIIRLICLLLGLAPAHLAAQTAIVTKKATVTFSGRLDLNVVYRSDEYFGAQKGNGIAGAGYESVPYIDPGLTNAERVSGVPGNFRQGSEFYLDPNLILNFTVDVGDRARGVIELRTPFVNPDAGGKNTTPGIGFFSNSSFESRTLELKQAYAEVDELGRAWLAGDGLLLRAGIMDFRKDLRGDGNSFLIDTARTEHPFDARIPGAGPSAGAMTGSPPRYSTGFADSTEAAGGYMRYGFPNHIAFLDGWAFNLDESYNAANYPRRDLIFYGGSVDIPLSDEGKFGKIFLTVFDLMNTSDTHLVTEGGGLVFYPLKDDRVNLIELFGEFYWQQGTYARAADAGTTFDIKQKDAFALNFGAKVKAPIPVGENNYFTPYLEGSYVEVSGDDKSTDSRNSNFVSLEGNNRTLVVEDGYYGLDIDTNYRGVRAALGATYKKVMAEVLYGYFEYQDNKGGSVAGGASSSEKIGDEFDFTVGYEYSANLKLRFTSGWLIDGRALGSPGTIQISLFQIIFDF